MPTSSDEVWAALTLGAVPSVGLLALAGSWTRRQVRDSIRLIANRSVRSACDGCPPAQVS